MFVSSLSLVLVYCSELIKLHFNIEFNLLYFLINFFTIPPFFDTQKNEKVNMGIRKVNGD